MARHGITASFVATLPEPGATRARLYYDAHPDAPTGFALRVTPNGAKAWVLNYYVNGRERRATIGPYSDTKGHVGLTATVARKRAKDLVNKIRRDGADPVGEQEAARVTARAEATRRRRRTEGTLQALLEAYVAHLKAAGKASHASISGAIKRNLTKPLPTLAATPADEITPESFLPALSRLTKAGKYREAEKLKAYASAAFRCAVKARTDATLAEDFGIFGVRANPLQEITVTRQEADDGSRKWALSVPQLAAYWKRISALDTPRGALLRFHLLSGGQRVEQLTRLLPDDYDPESETVRLLDGKGRRTKPRVHLVPLIADAKKALDAMRQVRYDDDGEPIQPGPFLFSVSNGREGAVYHTVREAMLEVATAMVEKKEIDRTFSPGIIRKTVETRLAAAGVSKEIRAQLQSHGIGGVQDKHYDAHDYLTEKKAALNKLRRLLDQKPGKVVKFPNARGG